MTTDPIVDEIRAIRDMIASEHNYDIDAIFDMLRELEANSTVPHVTLPPRRTAQQAAEAVGCRLKA